MSDKGRVVVEFSPNGGVDVRVEGVRGISLGRFEAALPRIYRTIGEAKAQFVRNRVKIAAAVKAAKEKKNAAA